MVYRVYKVYDVNIPPTLLYFIYLPLSYTPLYPSISYTPLYPLLAPQIYTHNFTLYILYIPVVLYSPLINLTPLYPYVLLHPTHPSYTLLTPPTPYSPSICGIPRGMGGMPSSWNLPRVLLSFVIALSPSKTWYRGV